MEDLVPNPDLKAFHNFRASTPVKSTGGCLLVSCDSHGCSGDLTIIKGLVSGSEYTAQVAP